MNALIELLRKHASVRQFTDRPITTEEEETIISTAQRSPTSSNLQAYSVIAVRETSAKARLAELTGDQAHVKESALFLVFCADLYRLERISNRKGYQFLGDYTELFIVATVDTALAAARALIAAQALGIGGVMVGGIRNRPDQVAQLLALPDFVYPVMGMSLGYPKAEAKMKARLPLQAVLHRERYDRTALDTYVREYDETIASAGYLKGRELNPARYSEFSGIYSWSEHSARRLADDSPTALRPHMLSFLQERGFLRR